MRKISHFKGFVSSNFNLVGNVFLFVLLCGLEAYLGSKFKCPTNYKIVLVYSCFFLILPVVMLALLSLMFARRYSRGILCKKCCSSKFFFFILLEVGRAPLQWILILLIDGRYFTCFLYGAFPEQAYYGGLDNARLYNQVAGLIGLTLYVSLTFYMTRGNRKNNFMTYWYRKQHERCLMQEVEKALQEKAEEKMKKMVEELVSKDYDTLNPKNGDAMEKMEELLLEYKAQVKKLLTETPEEKDVETGFQE